MAAVSATIAGSLFWAIVTPYGQIGEEGPNFWGYVGLLTELPGAVMAGEVFGSASPMVPIPGGVSGAVECFMVFWTCIAVFRGFSRRSDA